MGGHNCQWWNFLPFLYPGPAVKTPPSWIGGDSLFNVGPPGNPWERVRSAHTGSMLLVHGEKECLFKHFFSFFFSPSHEDSLTSHRRPTFSMCLRRVCSLLSIYLDFLPSDFLNQALLPFLYIKLVRHICFNAAKQIYVQENWFFMQVCQPTEILTSTMMIVLITDDNAEICHSWIFFLSGWGEKCIVWGCDLI